MMACCLVALTLPSQLLAMDETAIGDSSPPSAVTTVNPDIARDDLRIMVRPLSKTELEAEADAWFDLLRAKAKQIAAVRLAPRATDSPSAIDEAATETATNLAVQAAETVNQLRDERTAINDRLMIVLDSLDAKGGSSEEYRSYSKAVVGIELDTSNARTVWTGVAGWLISREGGQRLAYNLGGFLVILVIAYLAAKLVGRMVDWLLERHLKISKLAEKLISGTVEKVIMVIGFAIALTTLEIDITPLIAAIGATGLVVGLALQGTLSNFASGLLILINRPFDVGDFVNAGGVTGKIDQMNLVSTRFRTADNQTIYVPNNSIWNNVITNITANDQRRVDLEFGIGYADDFEQAEQIILDVVLAHPLVLQDPPPQVITHSLGQSSVDIVCRPWAKTSDWWQVKTDVTRQVKRRFDRAGISIPYPQQDVHIHYVGQEPTDKTAGGASR
jgi:small conductance mechanosensitive channel